MWLPDLASGFWLPNGTFIVVPSIVVLVLVYAIGRLVIEHGKRR